MQRFRQFWGVSLAILVLIPFLFYLLAADWSGPADRCFKRVAPGGSCDTAEICDNVTDPGCIDCCYCEAIHDGQIKQPQNTWSDLGFIFAGMAILLWVSVGDANPRRPRKTENVMVRGGFYANYYGLSVMLMGPGSMIFHASMGDFAGFLDSVSMLLPVLLLFWYDLSRCVEFFRGEALLKNWFWFYLATLILLLVVIYPLRAVWIWSSLIVILVAVAAVVMDLIVLWNGSVSRKYPRKGWILLIALLVFGSSVAIWLLGATEGPLCDTDGFQAHAIWHVGAAVAMFLFFVYLRSENRTGPGKAT